MRASHDLVLAALLTALAACSGAGSTPEPDPGCGDCVVEVRDIRAQVESLPWVEKVFNVSRYSGSPTNGAGVDVQVRSNTVGTKRQADELARIVWESKVQPLEVVDVTVEGRDGELVPTLPFDFRDTSDEYASYVKVWGERPVG